ERPAGRGAGERTVEPELGFGWDRMRRGRRSLGSSTTNRTFDGQQGAPALVPYLFQTQVVGNELGQLVVRGLLVISWTCTGRKSPTGAVLRGGKASRALPLGVRFMHLCSLGALRRHGRL